MPATHSLSRIVVAGASLAGIHAARTLREEGFAGELVVVGAEDERPYDRPPLSKGFLTGSVQAADLSLERPGEDLGVQWMLGRRAASLDVAERMLRLEDGTQVAYDGLVIATGATPRRLPLNACQGTHVLRTRADADALARDLAALPGRVAIVGAGMIGMELASSCIAAGRAVTVVEAGRLPMERLLGPQMAGMFAAFHRAHGVDLRCGVSVQGHVADAAGRIRALRLSDGTELDCAVVAVAVGVQPATGWLEGSGLVLDDGVVCDASCLAAPGIVACGDVARWPDARWGQFRRVEHWDNAVRQARHAARRLLAQDDAAFPPYEPTPWFWSDQFDRKLQIYGSIAPTDEVRVVEGSIDETRLIALYHRGADLRGVLCVNMVRALAKWRALVDRRASFDDAMQALVAADPGDARTCATPAAA